MRLAGISLQAEHVRRYRDIARLLRKYGGSDLVRAAGLDGAAGDEQLADGTPPARAEELAADLERMGPTFVKLGQLLSTRPDIVSPPYLEALSRLQNEVEAFPYEQVEQIVATELGVRISKAFSDFETTPFASASLGQVHRAALRDGRAVAVKVQRPGIRDTIVSDLGALEDIAEFVDAHTEAGRRYGFAGILHEFRKALLNELDYDKEAQNLLTLARNLSSFDRIVVPRPVEDYTTSRVLTMELIRGTKITRVRPLARLELDGAELVDQLFHAYLKQILEDGFFHADPHPGNVFLTGDGRLALLDLGMVARVAPEMQDLLIKLLLAVSEGLGRQAAEVLMAMGDKQAHFDEAQFCRRTGELVADTYGAELKDIHAGRVVVQMTRISGETGLRPPPELAMLGKALLNLEQLGSLLDPSFNPSAAIDRHLADVMRGRLVRSVTPGSTLSNVLEAKEFVERLPGRVNKLTDALLSGELRFKVDAVDEQEVIRGLQKVANRVTSGLVLAALIIGAAMLMGVQTSSRILGYPALAMVLFLLAAGGGFFLVADILVTDRWARRDRRGPG
jgi:ubiquinone biosynthesis protein